MRNSSLLSPGTLRNHIRAWGIGSALRTYSLRFFVWWSRSASKILRLDLLDVELGYSLAHCLKNIFQRRGVTLDPSQRVDARHDKRAQIWTHESAFLELLDDCGNLLLEVQHHRGPLLMMLESRTQRLITKSLKASQDRVGRGGAGADGKRRHRSVRRVRSTPPG